VGSASSLRLCDSLISIGAPPSWALIFQHSKEQVHGGDTLKAPRFLWNLHENPPLDPDLSHFHLCLVLSSRLLIKILYFISPCSAADMHSRFEEKYCIHLQYWTVSYANNQQTSRSHAGNIVPHYTESIPVHYFPYPVVCHVSEVYTAISYKLFNIIVRFVFVPLNVSIYQDHVFFMNYMCRY
jgi:hypothetical protein